MKDNFRIITDGEVFKVQQKFFWFIWLTVQRPENIDEKDFGGDACFDSLQAAKEYVEWILEPAWKVVK